MTDLLTTLEAADILQVSAQYVRKLLREGVLPGEKISGVWVIPISAIEDRDDSGELLRTIIQDRPRKMTSRTKPIALSFFSGAMGLDIGLEEAGFEVLLAAEVDKASKLTITQNKPDIALIGDVREYSADEVREAAGISKKEVIDLVAGGPPCQAFSTAGKRLGFDDERGNVFLNFVELILDLNPKYAVLENVRGLLSAPLKHRPHSERGFGQPPLKGEELPGGALSHIIRMLKAGGYHVTFNLYNAANYGTPQKRERVVIICSRVGGPVPFLPPTHSDNPDFGLKPHRTLETVIADLGEIEHHHVNFSRKRLKYYEMLGPGQNWRDLPEHIQREAMGKSYFAGGGKTGFYRRLAWDKPAPTLVTHPAMPATDLAHPEEDRPLSVQEYKRIQEFPDSWEICGSIVDQYRQIGNAVPISLGKAIGTTIMAHMSNEDIPIVKGFKYSRYRNTDQISWERARAPTLKSMKQKTLGL